MQKKGEKKGKFCGRRFFLPFGEESEESVLLWSVVGSVFRGVNPKSESEKRVIQIGGADFAREESKVCCEFLCWSAFRGEVRKKGVKI